MQEAVSRGAERLVPWDISTTVGDGPPMTRGSGAHILAREAARGAADLGAGKERGSREAGDWPRPGAAARRPIILRRGTAMKFALRVMLVVLLLAGMGSGAGA